MKKLSLNDFRYGSLVNDVRIFNVPSFRCGWISPDGNTFSCVDFNHVALARIIAEALYKDDVQSSLAVWDDVLIRRGWMKVRGPYNAVYDESIVSRAQLYKLLAVK